MIFALSLIPKLKKREQAPYTLLLLKLKDAQPQPINPTQSINVLSFIVQDSPIAIA